MGRVQAGDPTAFERLYDRHHARAYRVAGSICSSPAQAERAVRSGFLEIWERRHAFSRGGGTFRAWAMVIVRRAALATAGGEGSGRFRDASADADGGCPALAALPDQQAEVLALAYFAELGHLEIAEQLGLSPAIVKTLMRRGLEGLEAPAIR